MKKIFLISLLFVTANAVAATTYWWEQPTICRVNTTKCYTSMGAGYEPETWDVDGNCRGVKIICGEALTNPGNSVTLGRNAIQSGNYTNSDYDLTVLNTEEDCFGVRKTSTDGSMASVNGEMVRVWCDGALERSNIKETIENGDIAKTPPTCQKLAARGYAAVPSGRKCYGKEYDQSSYYIECLGDTPTLIVLNGATDIDPNGTSNAPGTQADADRMFDAMYNGIHSSGE